VPDAWDTLERDMDVSEKMEEPLAKIDELQECGGNALRPDRPVWARKNPPTASGNPDVI